MASDDQKRWLVDDQGEPKRNALMTRSMPATLSGGGQLSQRAGAQFGNLLDPRVSQGEGKSETSQIALLQSQLAQISQLRSDGALLETQPDVVAGEQYLVFSLLECECALKAEHIQGVERPVDITVVPNVAPWVRGVINLRGSIASVVDLRAFLDMEQLPNNSRTRLLSVQYNEMVICLVVDGVSEMVPIPETAITNILSTRQTIIPQWAIPYAYGSALLDKRAIVLLDAARLLFSDKMQRYEALE